MEYTVCRCSMWGLLQLVRGQQRNQQRAASALQDRLQELEQGSSLGPSGCQEEERIQVLEGALEEERGVTAVLLGRLIDNDAKLQVGAPAGLRRVTCACRVCVKYGFAITQLHRHRGLGLRDKRGQGRGSLRSKALVKGVEMWGV